MSSPAGRSAPEPFYESPGGRPSGDGPRILLISYHFPPGQAVGGLRWQKFSRFAAERGWGLDAIALSPEELDRPDRRRLEELPGGSRVYGVEDPPLWVEYAETGLWRLHRLLRGLLPRSPRDASGAATGAPGRAESVPRDQLDRLARGPRRWYRAYHAWLSHARGGRWARSAVEVGRRIADPRAHRVVISCGPPHMVHLAGREISRGLGIPFVMDMRDPWSLTERLLESVAHPVWLRLASEHETRCVEEAGLVVMNTEPARRAMQDTYPGAAERVIAVMNGYDEEELPVGADRGVFRVAFAGSIYLDRDPRPFLRAAAGMVRELGLGPEEIRIEFLGQVQDFDGIPLARIAADVGLESIVGIYPPRPRREALAFMAEAALLLSLPQDMHLAIPSKIFEYMRFPAWLMALAEPGSATERLLRDTNADVVDPDDLEGMRRVLVKRYGEFREEGRPEPLAGDGRFSRRSQAKKLLDALEPFRRGGSRPGTSGSVIGEEGPAVGEP